MTLTREEFLEAMDAIGLDPEQQEDAWTRCNEDPFRDWKFTQCLPYISVWYDLGLYDFLEG